MPILDQTVEAVRTPNNYHFTATRIADLGSTEYTLVTIICDVSSSVSSYRTQLEACIGEVRKSAEKSPRAHNLLLRLCAFNNRLKEIHGFRELAAIGAGEYKNMLKTGGCTALNEAAFEGIDATAAYGKSLGDRGLAANAIVFVITDGEDNASNRTPNHINDLIKRIWQDEYLESLVTVLIGVGGDPTTSQYLAEFQKKANLDHFLDLGQATPDNLAKLAGFISRSISMASISLSTGTAPTGLPLNI